MENETLIGRVRDGKMVHVSRRYNFLRGGNWKDGFSGVGHSGGEETIYEIINKELVDDTQPFKTYKFVVTEEKAEILE